MKHLIAIIVLGFIIGANAQAAPYCVQFVKDLEWRDPNRSQCRIYTLDFTDGRLEVQILCTRGPDYWYLGEVYVQTNTRNRNRCNITGGNFFRVSDQNYRIYGDSFFTPKQARIYLEGRDDGRRERIRALRYE